MVTIVFISVLWYEIDKAQKQDYIWLYGGDYYDVVLPDRAADTTCGSSNIDFNYDPPKIYYDPNRFLDFNDCNSSGGDAIP
jgi:hypothetical protein